MKQLIEYQAARIEAVLALHRVPGRVTGGSVTPRRVRFQVLPEVGVRLSRVQGLAGELAVALDVPAVRVLQRGVAVDIEVPHREPLPVQLLPLFRRLQDGEKMYPVTAVLGLSEDGAPLLVRLPSPSVGHILVTGMRGAGKTALLCTMALSLALTNPPPSQANGRGSGLNLVLVDTEGRAFESLQGLPHLARPVIRDVAEAVEAIHSLVRLMDRYRATQGSGNGSSAMAMRTRIVLLIDELADLLVVGKRSAASALIGLLRNGLDAGIHVVAATRQPVNKVLAPLVGSNDPTGTFPVRLVGRAATLEDARVASGWSGTGAERLLGHGDFLAIAEGRVIRFQAAYVSPAEIGEVVSCLAADQQIWPASRETNLVRMS